MATQSAEYIPHKKTDKRGVPLGIKLYGILAISFLCFIALSVYQLLQLKDTLETQRSVELKHLTELAVGVVKEEYEASQKGAISAEEAKTRAAARVAELRYGQNDYFWINDLEPKMVMHPTNPSLNGKNLAGTKDPNGVQIFREFNRAAQQTGGGYVNYSWPRPGSDKPLPKMSYVTNFAPWGWVIGSGVYIDDLHAQVWSQAYSQMAVIGLVLLLSGGLAVFFVRSISRVLISMTEAMARLAKGDLKVEIPGKERSDELGAMAGAMGVMVGTLEQFVKAQLDMANAHNRDGHVSHVMSPEAFSGAYRDMARNVNDMVKSHVDVQMQFVDLMLEYTNATFENRMEALPGERKRISDTAEKIRAELEAANKAQFNALVKAALDHVTIPVRIANDEGKILYVNHAMNEVLHKYEADFRQRVSSFNADKVVGGDLSMFFADPQAAVAHLRSIQRATHSRMVLGGRDFDVVTSPVRSESGERVGTAAQWSDVTDQLAAEKEVASLVEAAAAGDFSKRLAEANKSGFMLQMAQGLNTVLSTNQRVLAELGRILKALAEGDLSQTIEDDFQGVFAELKDDSNGTIERLRGIIQQIREASESINTAAREIAKGNQDLSRRAEDEAASLEETTASIHELSETVKQNAENAAQANRLATDASESAQRGGEVVGRVVATMSGITESNREIADITTLIDGIAFQTNLLALNAAVEAARAGEQGRGFAVVASEVRTLAQRAADAARDIKAVIAGSVGKVEEGAKLVQSAGAAMEDIVTQVRRVTAIMGEIASASKEQSAGVEQVNDAIVQIDKITQQNAALVEEASATAKSMEEQSEGLVHSVAFFKLAGERSDAGRREERPRRANTNGAANGKALH